MKQFRIKSDAVKYINEKHATSIYNLQTWDEQGIDINALDEVEEACLTYGIKSGDNSKSLCGWEEGEGGHYHFTIHFPSEKHREHDKFSDGRHIRKLMDKIQYEINNFYIQFANNEDQ